MALATIVIPTFNQAAYLPACVTAVCSRPTRAGAYHRGRRLGRRHQDFLDACPAGSAARMPSRGPHGRPGQRRARARADLSPKRRGRSCVSSTTSVRTRTYNAGWPGRGGNNCTYVPGDDLPYPHMIEELAEALERTGADFAYADQDVVEDDGGCIAA